jgi:cyclic pyranopterin phosphate synthase
MVDVSSKEASLRSAVAEGFVAASAGALAACREATAVKGDVLATARVAGIAAAKRTSEWIPLCHPLAVTHAAVEIELESGGFRVRCTVRARDCTGVEMEALTAVAASCLTLYDMLKAVDKTMEIGPIRLLRKEGGRSGKYERGTA